MKKTIALALPILGLMTAMLGPVRADDSPDQIKALLTNHAASIVTVRAVVKTQVKMAGQAQDSESRLDLEGAVVTSDGLIMITNMPFDNKNLAEILGMPGMDGLDIKTTPTDLKVIIGNEEKQYSAYLVATDTNRSLAFIKIEDLGDRKLQEVDFTSTSTPDEGARVYVVSRLNKGYDYAPYLQSGVVYGQIDKPQKAWIIGDSLEVGLPVFSSAGDALGVMTTVPSGVTEPASSGDGMDLGMIMRMAGGGSQSHLISTFLVPSSTVNSVITLAKQQAATKPKPTTPAVATKPSTPAPAAPK